LSTVHYKKKVFESKGTILTENRQRIILNPIVNLTIGCGIFDRYQNPVLTREHLPPFWMYDADPETNPYMMQRLGVKPR